MTALMSDSIKELVPALINAKSHFKPAVKDSTNPHFKSKFVSLAGMHDAVDDALLSNELVLSQQLDVVDGKNALVSRLMHTSGQWLASVYQLNPVKSDPQAEGSALTYARRYAAMALLGIAPEDDDGNAASQPPREQQQRRSAPVSAEPEPEMEDPSRYAAQIAAAERPDVLAAVGTNIATAQLAPAARQALRDQFSSRMTQLKAATAA